MLSPHQDLTAVLQMLVGAVSAYGCPHALVSDNGSVFTAKAYLGLRRDLAIEPLHSEKGKPWQNLLEAQFKVQLRLADFQFEQAQTFADVQAAHAAFIETFTPPPTAPIGAVMMAVAPQSRCWAGSKDGSSTPSGCGSSLAAATSCGRSTAMAVSVCSVFTSMRKAGSPGSE